MRESITSSKPVSEQLNQLNTLQQEIKAIFQKRPLKELRTKSRVYEAMDFILDKLAEISLLLKLAMHYVEAIDQNKISEKEQEKIVQEVLRAIRISSQMIVSKLLLMSKNTLFISTKPDVQMFNKSNSLLEEVLAGVYLHKHEDQSVMIHLVSEEVGNDTTKFILIPAEFANTMFANIRWPDKSSEDSYAMIEHEECKEIIFNTLPHLLLCQKVISEIKSMSTVEDLIGSEIRQICQKCCFIENDILEKKLSLDEQNQINNQLSFGLVNNISYSNIFSRITLSTLSWGKFSVKREVCLSLHSHLNSKEYINQMRVLLDHDFKDIMSEVKKNTYKIIRISNKGTWSKQPIPKNLIAPKTIYLYRDSKSEKIIYALVLHEKNRKELLKINDLPHYNKEYEGLFKSISWDNMEIIGTTLQDRIISYLHEQKSQSTPQNFQITPKVAIAEDSLKINEIKDEYSHIQRSFEISKKKIEEYQTKLPIIKKELQGASSLENKMVEKINNIKESPVIHLTSLEEQLNKIRLSIEELQNSKESKSSELTTKNLKEEMNNFKKRLVDISEEFIVKMIYLDDCYTTYKNRESALKRRSVQSKFESSSKEEKPSQHQAAPKISPQKEILQGVKSSKKLIISNKSSSFPVKDKTPEVKSEEKIKLSKKIENIPNIITHSAPATQISTPMPTNNNEQTVNLFEPKIVYIEKKDEIPSVKSNKYVLLPMPKEDLVDTLYLQISAQAKEVKKEKNLNLTGIDLDISRACSSYLMVRFFTVLYEKNKNKNNLDYKSLKVYRYLRNCLLKCIFLKNEHSKVILDENIFDMLSDAIKSRFEDIHKKYKENGKLDYNEISNFCKSIKQKLEYTFDQAWTAYDQKKTFDSQDIKDIISYLKKIQDILKPIPHNDLPTLRNEPNRLMAVKFFLAGVSQIYKDHVKDNLYLCTIHITDKERLEGFLSKITILCRNETGHNSKDYLEVGEDVIFKINSQIDNIIPILRQLESHPAVNLTNTVVLV